MNKKALLPLALTVLIAGLTGCSHQTTRAGSKSNYGLGLVQIERGSFQPAPVISADMDTNQNFGDAGKVSGTQTKILWGLFSFNDY